MLLIAALTFSVMQVRGQEDYPFKSGEYGLYGAYYNWQFIWIQSGEVSFHADTIQFEGHKVWHLKALGKTFKAYDFFYSVRDTFEVYTTYDHYQPLFFRRVLNHGKTSSYHQYRFDADQHKVYSFVKRDQQPAFHDTLPLKDEMLDLVSSSYYFRSYDFDSLHSGEKVSFRLLVDNEIHDLYFHYLGKENVETRNGKEFRCHKVSVYLLGGDFFDEGEYMKIWFTDDRNRVPVQVETKILVGSVKAVLLDTENLKYPVTSEIK